MSGFKPSQYNYLIDGEGGELLLFNSRQGENSLICLKGENATKVKLLLKEDCNSQQIEEEKELFDILLKHKYIIKKNVDEQVLMEDLGNQVFNCNVLRLIILPTGQCNFRCKYCYEDFCMGTMDEEIQEGIIRYVNKNIHNYSTLRVSWFGGEPLLAFPIVEHLSKELIAVCNRQKRNYVADITTNGYLLDEQMMRKLLKLRVYSYQITLDGLEATHDFNKPLRSGEGTYQKILNNIRDIKSNIHTGRFEFIIRCNVTVDMVKEIIPYFETLNQILKKDKRFKSFLRPAGDWGYNDNIEQISQKFVLDSGMNDLFEYIEKSDIEVNLSNHLNYLNPNGYVCYASYKNSYVITPDGKVEKCTCHLNDEKNIIGKLYKNGEMEIDEYLAAQWTSIKYHSEDCNSCIYTPICNYRGCPARRIILNHASDNIYCPVEKNNLQYLIKILYKNNKELFEILG